MTHCTDFERYCQYNNSGTQLGIGFKYCQYTHSITTVTPPLITPIEALTDVTTSLVLLPTNSYIPSGVLVPYNEIEAQTMGPGAGKATAAMAAKAQAAAAAKKGPGKSMGPQLPSSEATSSSKGSSSSSSSSMESGRGSLADPPVPRGQGTQPRK
jgi:hypothetical protein